MKRSGSNLLTCCPIHNEETPSFTINLDKEIYHCFGCGINGSINDLTVEIKQFQNDTNLLSYEEIIEDDLLAIYDFSNAKSSESLTNQVSHISNATLNVSGKDYDLKLLTNSDVHVSRCPFCLSDDKQSFWISHHNHRYYCFECNSKGGINCKSEHYLVYKSEI